MGVVRILFLADTHLGFDYPFRPRIEMRRRGPDFFANYQRVLDRAIEEKFDLVIHGGDILFRSKVPAGLVDMAFAPLRTVADRKIPVFVVPGNHERSAIPFRLLAEHPDIHIFDVPRTFCMTIQGVKLALAGFPFVRDGVRSAFPGLVEQTGWRESGADISLLCIHQCVEGATVGPADYTFRGGDDVVRSSDIPPGLTAVLSGHIHRRQILTRDLWGGRLRSPVLYPGSIERTSFAEKDEVKGYLTLMLDLGEAGESGAIRWVIHDLPTRPMATLSLSVERQTGQEITSRIQSFLAGIPGDSIVRIDVRGRPGAGGLAVLGAASLRGMAPPEMNVSISFPEKYG